MNTKKLIHFLTSASLLFLSATTIAHSASGGVVHFSGSIVEGGCTINNTQNVVNVGCPQAGGKVITTQIPFNAKDSDFPGGKVSEVKWLNPQHTVGIISISYS